MSSLAAVRPSRRARVFRTGSVVWASCSVGFCTAYSFGCAADLARSGDFGASYGVRRYGRSKRFYDSVSWQLVMAAISAVEEGRVESVVGIGTFLEPRVDVVSEGAVGDCAQVAKLIFEISDCVTLSLEPGKAHRFESTLEAGVDIRIVMKCRPSGAFSPASRTRFAGVLKPIEEPTQLWAKDIYRG